MITLTKTATEKFAEYIGAEEEPGYGVRIGIVGRGPDGFMYDISLAREDEKADDDAVIEPGPFKVFVDAGSLDNLKGATIDYISAGDEEGFKVDNPNPLWRDARAKQIQRVLDEEINPGVASHGGHVTLLDIKDDTVFVMMGGGCQGCGMANVTLKSGIETAIRRDVPSIVQVLDTTDHASGENPFYQPSKGGQSPLA